MARPHRLNEIAQERGEALDTLIPRTLNEQGTMEKAAKVLGTTMQTIFQWCKANRVEKQITWVKREPVKETVQ